MSNLEIPIGKRTFAYRFFEMLPGITSWGSLILLVVLSIFNPFAAGVYVLAVTVTVLVKAIGIAFHTLTGSVKLHRAQMIDWKERLTQLQDAKVSLKTFQVLEAKSSDVQTHLHNLQQVAAQPMQYPKPSQLYNAVIIATYNESYDVLKETIDSVVNTTYNNQQIILVLAYEERGGIETEKVARRLQKDYRDTFYSFIPVRHPDNMPGEVRGKGGNITYAGEHLASWLCEKHIPYEDVIVTTLDSDNRPHRTYFDYLAYEYIVHENRKQLAYQPVSLFLNNIWDVPAPMRVVATGNSFWNIISSMRPHTLRNFASHSQPMSALVEMDFWSTRTIVEDGHQYWRSYFFFHGDYEVVPIYVPIYQDAVLSDTYVKTLKAQFVQLRRWAYGASDVPYVATRLFTRDRKVPFWAGVSRLVRLLDGHVTLAVVALIVTFGGWVPLLINTEAARSVVANQLPEVLSVIQRLAMIGLLLTVFLAFKMLPPRPSRYKRHRTLGMILQWVLMPVTSICYSAAAALYSQTRLLLGIYLDRFDVTEKVTIQAIQQSKSVTRRKK